MANIRRIENKNGVSYKITVTHGRDTEGKQVRHYMTWTPAQGMTEKQMQKEVQRIAFEFEEAIKNGYAADGRQTFSEYAKYVLDLKEREGVKHKTLEAYKNLLTRINPAIGHMKLNEIRPQHLNRFYKALSASGVRGGLAKATPKVDIGEIIKALGLSHKAAGEQAGLSSATIDAICRGQTVSDRSAEKLSAWLGEKTEKLFNVEHNNNPLSNKTILEYHRCIHTILTQAEKEMLVPFNAASKATPPKVTRKEVNYFQPEELSEILDALEDEPLKWQLITNLLIVTGCRRGEIAALKWSKIDFEKSRIRIDATLLYSPDCGVYENATKTGDTRFLKLPNETMQLLKEYRRAWLELRFKNGDRWIDTDYLFTRDEGGMINPDSITSWLGDFSKRKGLPHINPHAFRHTVASVLINNGQDVVTVSRRLGHSRTSTTLDVYAHMIAEADADAAECIADTLLRRA